MARNRATGGLDGAGISSAAEYTSRLPPLPIIPTTDTNGAHQALLARTEGMNSLPAPSIQLIPATDPTRSQRPSLDFRRITRVLPQPNAIIKVGRYSERETILENPSGDPSDAPIGFKSKVVSRKHCEFFFQNGQWYIKDVKSSSGTFLNRIRLSQPGLESKPFPVNDGDIVQLGIDFKGGEEMIFRCVKIKVETNRGWQRGLNKFNKSTHKQLQRLARGNKDVDSDTASKHSTECTICLNPIAPCQALFVAPCSHTWHYKCIRTIIENSEYPSFTCPNCRAQADLDAEVEEEDLEDYDEFHDIDVAEYFKDEPEIDRHDDVANSFAAAESPTSPGAAVSNAAHGREPANGRVRRDEAQLESPSLLHADELAWTLDSLSLRQNEAPVASLDDTISAFPAVSKSRPSLFGFRARSAETRGANNSSLNPSASAFVPSPSSSTEPAVVTPSSPDELGAGLAHVGNRRRASYGRSNTLSGPDVLNVLDGRSDAPTPTADRLNREGPMTPRNAVGPFVFDGAGRTGSSPRGSAEAGRVERDTTMIGSETDQVD
ncbi:MAG: hypothetical protein Q9162_007943 [Coniocarpon cinnabarinum]